MRRKRIVAVLALAVPVLDGVRAPSVDQLSGPRGRDNKVAIVGDSITGLLRAPFGRRSPVIATAWSATWASRCA